MSKVQNSTNNQLYGMGGAIINGMGDSITAQGQYQPPGVANTPAWQPNTTYTAGQQTNNGGYIYRCTTGGVSAASGGPTTFTSSITDNTVVWKFMAPTQSKYNTSDLFWWEVFSMGAVYWDQASAIDTSGVSYGGSLGSITHAWVTNGGSGYAAGDTVTLSGGATGTLTIAGGVITGITITNPGYNTGAIAYTINTSTGSGGQLAFLGAPTGTFAMTGNQTFSDIAMLPDAVASPVDIFRVLIGTNDVTNGITYPVIVANIQKIVEKLTSAGKKVVLGTLLPRNGLTAAQNALRNRVNAWIRSYCRKVAVFNPAGIVSVRLADYEGYLLDGANASGFPIGGAGGAANAMMQDGLHPAVRAAMYMGYVDYVAASCWTGLAQPYAPRSYSMSDGFDPVNNPGGNLLEGCPWQLSTAYTLGQLCSNSGNVYRCTTAGISAASGGPTVTSGTATDGSVVWTYLRKAGMSVCASGAAGTQTAATGITYSGSTITGTTLSRSAGSASGTVACSIESPWSSGQNGQRQVLSFSLGGGAANEAWQWLILNTAYATLGIPASDIGSAAYFAEMEVELSNVLNLCTIYPLLQDTNGYLFSKAGNGNIGTGLTMWNSAGEMLAYPNGGKLYLRSQPMVLPANLVNLNLSLQLGFDASGAAAGSATATAKVNYIGLRKFGVA